MDELLSLLLIGVSILMVLLLLLGIGSFYGGNMETVAQGVTKFIFLVTCCIYGFYVLVKLMGRR